jgi:hypothetical protein
LLLRAVEAVAVVLTKTLTLTQIVLAEVAQEDKLFVGVYQ